MDIPFKQIIGEIDKSQRKTRRTLNEFLEIEPKDILERHHRGLYWFWTKLNSKELMQYRIAVEGTREVPIHLLVAQRQNLNHVCKVEEDGFQIVYNGIGGYKKEPANFGLRERIYQELNSNHHLTGTINLLNRSKQDAIKENWCISFFDFDDKRNKDILKQLKSKNPYTDYAPTLELLWRLEFGIPILTRH